MITDKGRALLGDAAPKRWVDFSVISAVSAKDVLARARARYADVAADDADSAADAAPSRKRPREGKWAYSSVVSERMAG